MSWLDRGELVWLAALTPLFGFDAYLVLTGHDTLSTHARRHPLVSGSIAAYLTVHLLARGSHRYDPLSVVGRHLRSSRPKESS